MLDRISLIGLFLISSCSSAAKIPDGAEVLPGSFVEAMLAQCSRASPERGEGTWVPEAFEISALEARISRELPNELQKSGWVSAKDVENFPVFPDEFQRQYVGIIRHGRKYIYGNFSPKDSFVDIPAEVMRRERVITICDGGPVFFGVEFDPQARRFTQWGFNGVA